MSDTILRLPEVKARTGLSRSTLYALIREGKFPLQVPLNDNGRAVGFLEREVSAWISQRVTQRDASKQAAK